MKEKLKSFIKSKKGGQILFIVGIAGIVLIYLSSLIQGDKTERQETVQESTFSQEEYTAHLEQQVREIVAAISGDTSAVVTVTLDGGLTYIYAEDKKQQNETDENKKSEETEHNYIIVKNKNGDEQPLIVTTKLPQVRGVAIVCGPTGESTREKIKSAVTAALDITQREIYIADRTN